MMQLLVTFLALALMQLAACAPAATITAEIASSSSIQRLGNEVVRTFPASFVTPAVSPPSQHPGSPVLPNTRSSVSNGYRSSTHWLGNHAVSTRTAQFVAPARENQENGMNKRSDWHDSFGILRSDQFSVVLYSISAYQYIEPQFRDNFYVNISGIAGSIFQKPFCDRTDAPYLGWIWFDTKAEVDTVGLEGKVDVLPDNMCQLSYTQAAYNETQISYLNTSIIVTQEPTLCQRLTQTGGEWLVAANATGSGVMRCVLDVAGIKKRGGAH